MTDYNLNRAFDHVVDMNILSPDTLKVMIETSNITCRSHIHLIRATKLLNINLLMMLIPICMQWNPRELFHYLKSPNRTEETEEVRLFIIVSITDYLDQRGMAVEINGDSDSIYSYKVQDMVISRHNDKGTSCKIALNRM